MQRTSSSSRTLNNTSTSGISAAEAQQIIDNSNNIGILEQDIKDISNTTVPGLTLTVVDLSTNYYAYKTSNNTAVAAVVASAAANATAIATNTTNIAANATAIATNTTNIANTVAATAANAGNIATNTTNIANTVAATAANAGNIATNTTAIAANTAANATQNGRINLNESQILDLSGDFHTLTDGWNESTALGSAAFKDSTTSVTNGSADLPDGDAVFDFATSAISTAVAALGTAATKNFTTTVTNGSGNLPDSDAVYDFVTTAISDQGLGTAALKNVAATVTDGGSNLPDSDAVFDFVSDAAVAFSAEGVNIYSAAADSTCYPTFVTANTGGTNNKLYIETTTTRFRWNAIAYRLYVSNIWVNGSNRHTSDDRAKHNAFDISNALTTLSKLKPQTYIKTPSILDESGNVYPADYNFPADQLDPSSNLPKDISDCMWQSGFVAQDVEQIPELKHLVGQEETHTHLSGECSCSPQLEYSLNYDDFHAYSICAINELHEKVLALEAEINILKGQV